MLAVCIGLGVLSWFGVSPFLKPVQQAEQKLGSVVDSNVPWWTGGYKYGNSNELHSADVLTIQSGQDQVVWKNNTGQVIIVTDSSLYLNGATPTSVASSTYSVAVGATTTATIAEPYKNNWEIASSTSDFPDLLITNFMFSTSTPAGIPTAGINYSLLTDNITYHASSTSALSGVEIVVPPGAYLFAKVDSTCVTVGNCETSTSTNRGFTTVTIPFKYYYSSPN